MTKTPNSSAAGVESVETNGLVIFLRKETEMTNVYAIYSTGQKAPTFKVFASEEEALNSGNGFSIVKEKTCLSDKRLFSTNTLVGLYNTKAERRISKFRDRETAESRVWKMLTESKCEVTMSDNHFSERAKHFAEMDSKIAKSGKTRKSKNDYAGKIITTTCFQNPRKKKTGHGFFSMQLIINSMDSSGGISYEDYISGGGRLQDLKWDLERGWASIDEKLDVS